MISLMQTKLHLPMQESLSEWLKLSQSAEDKYMVDIIEVTKAIPAPKESLETIKGAVKGKGLARMKKEAVDCPVKGKRVSFVECFTCPNFNRRVRGKVGCAGLPLPS